MIIEENQIKQLRVRFNLSDEEEVNQEMTKPNIYTIIFTKIFDKPFESKQEEQYRLDHFVCNIIQLLKEWIIDRVIVRVESEYGKTIKKKRFHNIEEQLCAIRIIGNKKQ